MTQAEAAAAIRARLATISLSEAMPFVWENSPFNPETDGGERGWLFTEFRFVGGEQVSIGDPVGGNTFRSNGVAVVNIVVPRNDKIGRAETVADAVIAHFKSESISGLHITNRWIGGGRLREQDSRWFALPVFLEFWTDRLETPA